MAPILYLVTESHETCIKFSEITLQIWLRSTRSLLRENWDTEEANILSRSNCVLVCSVVPIQLWFSLVRMNITVRSPVIPLPCCYFCCSCGSTACDFHSRHADKNCVQPQVNDKTPTQCHKSEYVNPYSPPKHPAPLRWQKGWPWPQQESSGQSMLIESEMQKDAARQA